MKHIIWTNYLDYDDWRTDMEAYYPDEEGFTDDDRMRLMYEINDEYLEDEKVNLNKELGRQIVVYANLGLWDGNRIAAKVLKGTNLNNIFSNTCGDFVEWYVEGEDVKCKDSHHDGTNYYTYRVLKKGYSEYDFDELVYDNPITDVVKDMTEPLGHYVAEIYGFKMDENVTALNN